MEDMEEKENQVARLERLKSVIDATDKNLARLSNEAWAALQMANDPPSLFRCGKNIVEMITGENNSRPYASLLTVDRLRHLMARVVYWKVLGKGRAWISAYPPVAVMKDMLATVSPPLPILNRIVSVPVFAPSRELQTTPGYHPDSQTYFAPVNGLSIPEIKTNPTRKDAFESAVFLMDELLQDFPFVNNKSDIAHALGFLTLFVSRELINGCTPLHIFEAACHGTGKTLLSEILCHVGLGHFPDMLTEAHSQDEWRKRITATLLELPPLVFIENLQQRLDSPHLAAAITMSDWKDRRLGVTEMVKAPVRTIWAATGNNPTFSGEMARRSIRIRLIAKSERPWLSQKEFKHPDIKKWVAENHGELLGKLLTMVKAWIVAGCPLSSKKLGMFEEWAQTIGGILEFAGIPGFLENLDEFYEASDFETQSLGSFIRSWYEKYLTAEVGTSELFDLASEFLDLGFGNERSQRTCLGKKLGRLRDRQIEGFLVIGCDIVQGARQWRLQQVDNPIQVTGTS